MIAKYGYLMLTGASPDKEIPDIDFTDEAVVQQHNVMFQL